LKRYATVEIHCSCHAFKKSSKLETRRKIQKKKKNLVLDLNLKNRFVLYKIESKRGIEIDNLFGFKNLKNQP
jgi:hypothetical protein